MLHISVSHSKSGISLLHSSTVITFHRKTITDYCAAVKGNAVSWEMEFATNPLAQQLWSAIAMVLLGAKVLNEFSVIYSNFEMHVKWVLLLMSVGYCAAAAAFNISDCYCYCRFQSKLLYCWKSHAHRAKVMKLCILLQTHRTHSLSLYSNNNQHSYQLQLCN